MAYEPNVMQQAMARLLRRKEIRERKRSDLEQELYRREPRLREVDRASRGTMTALTELAVSGRPVEADGPEIREIRTRNLKLQAQRAELMQALGVTNALAESPVFRPCIGMDKEEIVQVARMIDTFETSILPFEDCCTVFTPRHPKTRPVLSKVEEQEQKLPVDELVEEAFATLESFYIRAKF